MNSQSPEGPSWLRIQDSDSTRAVSPAPLLAWGHRARTCSLSLPVQLHIYPVVAVHPCPSPSMPQRFYSCIREASLLTALGGGGDTAEAEERPIRCCCRKPVPDDAGETRYQGCSL